MFANLITNEKCTNTKYHPRSFGVKIIKVEHIKMNTIFGDTMPPRDEFLSKVLIQLSHQTQLYMSSILGCPFILFVCMGHYLLMADLHSRNM